MFGGQCGKFGAGIELISFLQYPPEGKEWRIDCLYDTAVEKGALSWASFMIFALL